MSKELTKLNICPCQVAKDGTFKQEKNKAYTVMLNPNKFSHTYKISYSQTKTLGQMASDTKFSGIEPESISFDILLDHTGVIPDSSDVQTQIKKLNNVVYTYNGSRHEPNHVRLLWGSLLFYGRLKSMSAEYTLFSPEGKPLRAEVKLAFTGFMSTQEEARRANRSSPDMTHTVVFKAGDSLPLLCHRIYNDAGYYTMVAHANDITNFRNIAPGTRIVFPPLR